MTRERKPPNADLTPHAGAATDIAPLGRSTGQAAARADGGRGSRRSRLGKLAASAEFKALLKAKAKFIVPATVFFIAYYFSLPLLVGYAPQLMAKKVFGVVNVAYLFALSQFFMAWLIAWAYVRAAGRFDRWRAPSSTQAGASVPSSPDVPRLHRGHAVDHVVGRAQDSGSSAFFAAGRSLKAWQNGIAVAGDYMSAASFLGIAGIIAFQGYDGFMYSVGWLVAYLTVLLIVAEPLRNAGKYTMADVLAYRLSPRPVRAMGAFRR